MCETSGLLLLDKKPGITSFAALNEVKRIPGTGKVGHTGTLDKFAGGLLPVLAGRAVKLAPWFSCLDKEYEGTVRFGVETDTLDPGGVPVHHAEIPSLDAVEKALPLFTGAILQAPPAYSAVHVGGKRASELARAGKAPEMKRRPVFIYSLELTSWEPPLAGIRLSCSSGTYVRSLARDLALAAGSRGHLAALTRTRVAGFHLSDAGGLFFRPIDITVIEALGLPWFEINSHDVQKIIHGQPLEPVLEGAAPHGTGDSAAVFSDASFIAMVEKRDGIWKYGYVYR
ncbi:MAG: tRNA pseudouridine(55) synthase TruB [Treponema sp.]|jgi:tRNA pseudouridine55 synthase|nr:tRNA pseudouridine(55) synthase TruB [Treponema sp.]